jgi:hypothetical protein
MPTIEEIRQLNPVMFYMELLDEKLPVIDFLNIAHDLMTVRLKLDKEFKSDIFNKLLGLAQPEPLKMDIAIAAKYPSILKDTRVKVPMIMYQDEDKFLVSDIFIERATLRLGNLIMDTDHYPGFCIIRGDPEYHLTVQFHLAPKEAD